jgi:hypothetical protein
MKQLCKMSLMKYEAPELVEFRDDLCSTFARFIYLAFGEDPRTGEVDLSKIKEELLHGDPDNPNRRLFVMFCCAEGFDN